MKLDEIPDNWETRTALFVAYKIQNGTQSSSIKSYVSAIKCILINDKYDWKDGLVMISSLTKACHLVNDKLVTRLPIHCGLLELILFKIRRFFTKKNQYYLEVLYSALYALGYYGMLRVGELTMSDHVIKAANIHIATNKDKLLIILQSSKTHDEGCKPQKVKTESNRSERSGAYLQRNFCPFALIRRFIQIRDKVIANEDEPFFIFRINRQ